MIIEVYSLKLSMSSKYALSLVSNTREGMSSVADLVSEKCCTDILHDDMTLARLRVYAQSIE